MIQKNFKGVILGAIVGTMIGSLSAVIVPKRQKIMEQMKKAKTFTDGFYNGMKNWSEPRQEMNTSAFMKGALSGLLLGAGVAAFVTPKTGKQLRNNLTRKYQDVADKTQELMQYVNEQGLHMDRQNISRPTAKRKAPRHAAKKVAAKGKH